MPEFRWLNLEPHPSSVTMGINGLRFGYALQADLWMFGFEVHGELETLNLARMRGPQRGDRLWEHSCFEFFAAGANGGYREFNFAPDGRYAAYDFDAYRQGQKAVGGPVLAEMSSSCEARRYRLEVTLTPPPAPRHGGPAAILRDTQGRRSWWALRHGPGPADFHHPRHYVIPLQ